MASLGLPPLPNLHRWYEQLLARPAFVRGCAQPERIHAGLDHPAVADPEPAASQQLQLLPEWHRQYLRQAAI